MSPGEEFAVQREDHGVSGFATRVEPLAGVRHLRSDRERSPGFGGVGRVLERFRCDRAGTFHLAFVEGRPWEDAPTRATVTVHCR